MCVPLLKSGELPGCVFLLSDLVSFRDVILRGDHAMCSSVEMCGGFPDVCTSLVGGFPGHVVLLGDLASFRDVCSSLKFVEYFVVSSLD